jgi:hypothetical protein
MVIISGIIGILGGLLAMSSLIVKRAPNAQEQLAKLAQYQGWIGLTMFGWGVWELIHSVMNIGGLASAPIGWAFWFASAVADVSVGLLLGFGLISTYAFRGNEMAIAKGAQIRDRLVTFQVPLGVLAIVTSTLYMVW